MPFLSFSTISSIAPTGVEITNNPDANASIIEFGHPSLKVGNKNTLLIRLSVRSKPKRKAILDGLKKHIAVSKNSNFIK